MSLLGTRVLTARPLSRVLGATRRLPGALRPDRRGGASQRRLATRLATTLAARLATRLAPLLAARFGSRNCLREITASIEQGKPLVLVQEQQEDKGGGPLELLKAECRDDQMREAIFDGRTPIAWHRISHFQSLTLKLIATEMLHNGPRFQGSLSEGNAPEDLVLIQHGEPNVSELILSQPLILWCSTGNPGAAEFAEELVTSMASNGAAICVVNTMPDVQALKEYGKSAVMLLYLNKDTWVEQGRVLARDVRAAKKLHSGLKILMVHENEKEKGSCEFSDFFGITPQELIDDGIYRSACIH